MVTNLIIIGVTSLLPATAVGLKGNTSLGIFNSDIFNCKIGKQYFDTAKNKCQRCPQCPKARNFRNYQISISETHGASDCYPCYCKPEKKVFNPFTGGCKRCPKCTNGQLNKTVKIPVDRYKGGLDCYECYCNPNYYKNYLTEDQCVSCTNCSAMNRLFDQHCSKDKDAKCGRCIEGYTEPKFSVQPCVIDTVHIPLTTTNNPRTLHMPLEVTVNEMNTTLSFNYMPKSQIIIEVVLMITSVLTLGIIFVIYRIIRRLHCYLNDDLVLVSTSEKAESTTTPCNQKQEGPVLSTPLFENLHKVHNHEECNDKDGGGNYDSEPIQKVASSNNGSIYVVVQKGDNNNIVFNTADDQMPS